MFSVLETGANAIRKAKSRNLEPLWMFFQITLCQIILLLPFAWHKKEIVWVLVPKNSRASVQFICLSCFVRLCTTAKQAALGLQPCAWCLLNLWGLQLVGAGSCSPWACTCWKTNHLEENRLDVSNLPLKNGQDGLFLRLKSLAMCEDQGYQKSHLVEKTLAHLKSKISPSCLSFRQGFVVDILSAAATISDI